MHHDAAKVGVLFQSTLPCGERPAQGERVALARSVSIHAPVRGSDHEALAAAIDLCPVSIHAPVRGATLRCQGARF